MPFLPPPAWASDPTFNSAGGSTGSLPPVVSELVQSLLSQRQRREVELRLRESLRDVKAQFSFARVKGLRRLLSLLASAASSDKGVELFRESQRFQELQVIPALFKHTLAPQKSPAANIPSTSSDESTTVISSSSTPAEIVLGLRVLQGCCLLDNPSKMIAAQHMAVKELLELLSASGPERAACLDALLALMVDSPANQKEFDYYRGMQKVAESIKNGHIDYSLRIKCSEFLLLLVGDVLAKSEQVQSQLKESLGTESSVIILDVYSKLGLSDPEKKRRSLHGLAEKILTAVDS